MRNTRSGILIKYELNNSGEFPKAFERCFIPVVLNLFLHALPPFIKQDYQIYPKTLNGAHFLKI